jgi:hypothetical protein
VATLERLRHVDGAELRFRLACELRKARGRVRAAVTPARWKRRDLAGRLADHTGTTHIASARTALQRGNFDLAHRELVAHFSSRPPRFPLIPARLANLSVSIAARFPDARTEAAARADRMLEGRYDVLGYRDVEYGTPPQWLRDPVHGRQPPFAFWASVPYLDPSYGDHKVIWEINRHQHWLGLGRAYHLTGDRRYYDAFVSQLEDWMARNPPLLGVNWTSMLELAFRSLSWIWALHFFVPAAAADPHGAPPWTVDLLLGLDRQLTHIEENLSQYFSPNTHLSGEALGLFVSALTLPELAGSPRRAGLGRRILLEEASRQVNSDGGHAELSAHYHRYSTDFYLLAALVARLTGDGAASALHDAAARQARFLRAIADDNGRLPRLGDDDGGQLFPVCGGRSSDCRDTLGSAAAVLNDPGLGVGDATEETFWFCGHAVSDRPAVAIGSASFPSTGYYVSRNAAGDHLIFDAGRHGYLNGGHAHSDALSLVLTTAGRPFLVDAGTGTYTMDAAIRDRFRSTAIHNTIVLDGREQALPRGPFHWSSRADGTCLVWKSEPAFDYVEGIHDGYRPKAHARAVFALHGLGWLVIDHLLGPEGSDATADGFWHIHPDWTRTPSASGVSLKHNDGTVRALVSTADLHALTPDEAGGLDGYSPAYGVVDRGLCLRMHAVAGLPHTIATFITGVASSDMPRIEPSSVATMPGPGWHGAAFRLCWRGQQAIVLSAVERSPAAVTGARPGTMWGCDRGMTDARAAYIPVEGASSRAPALIGGARVETAQAGATRA